VGTYETGTSNLCGGENMCATLSNKWSWAHKKPALPYHLTCVEAKICAQACRSTYYLLIHAVEFILRQRYCTVGTWYCRYLVLYLGALIDVRRQRVCKRKGGYVNRYRYGGEKEESPKWSGESRSPVSKSKEIHQHHDQHPIFNTNQLQF
jgi:hypothetical protein